MKPPSVEKLGKLFKFIDPFIQHVLLLNHHVRQIVKVVSSAETRSHYVS
jgi:uncharacterized membrane protein